MKLRYSTTDIPTTAKAVLEAIQLNTQGAAVVGLQGDLGAGKTTLTQAIAVLLGVTETVVSPTFTIAKLYQCISVSFDRLIHIDAYRIESLEELGPLGFAQMIKQPRTLIIIEWPDRITAALPSTTQYFMIDHVDTERIISTTL